jgi:alpha-1,3-mannosylglycoprotein beta-1,4-N-acetylglucosaminyltransferase A/B
LLINNLKSIKTQVKQFKSPKSLFQHFGLSSSLKGKIQKLTDKNFKDGPSLQARGRNIGRIPNLKKSLNVDADDLAINYKSTKVLNPQAEVQTSMESHGSFIAVRAYNVNMNGFFWAKSPNTSDFYRIVFYSPVNITGIQIKTGHPTRKVDRLENAIVKVGYFSEKDKCKNSMILGSVKEGQFEMTRQKPLLQISCLEIFVTKPQSAWMILYEVSVRTTETDKENKTMIKQ